MGIFTEKSRIEPEHAMIGELAGNGDIVWNIADFEYCWVLFQGGVLEDRGYRTINGIHYRLFYLPPPKQYREYEG